MGFVGVEMVARRGEPLRPEQLEDHDCVNIRQTSGRILRWPFAERLPGGDSREFEIAVTGPLIVNGAAMSVSAAVSAWD